MANSYKYGFIFRYPGSKAEITGVAEEVWHYRYVGTEAALEIYEQGVCLEEYTEGSQTKQKRLWKQWVSGSYRMLSQV